MLTIARAASRLNFPAASIFSLGPRRTKEELGLFGRPRDLHDAN
jgi:hypothetical protein